MWCDFSLRLTEKWGGKKQIFSDYYIKRTWGGGQRYEGWVWQDRHISLNRVDLKRDFITVLLLSSCLHLIKTPWVPCACALLSCVLDLLDRSLQAVSLSTHHRELALAEGPKNYQNPPKTHTQLLTNSDGINTLPKCTFREYNLQNCSDNGMIYGMCHDFMTKPVSASKSKSFQCFKSSTRWRCWEINAKWHQPL